MIKKLDSLIKWSQENENKKNRISLIKRGKKVSLIRLDQSFNATLEICLNEYDNEVITPGQSTLWMDNTRKPIKFKMKNALKQFERIEKGLKPTNQPRRVILSLSIER